MTTAIDIAFLLVYVLGAFAYGSALTLSLRQAAPVWTGAQARCGKSHTQLEASGVALFAWSAVWFVVLGLDQFIDMATGVTRRSWLDLMQLILVFGFPPLIMHTTQREGHVSEWPDQPRAWARRALAVGYLLAGLGAVLAVGIAVRLWGVPNADLTIGLTIAGLFTLAGIYSSAVLQHNPRRAQTPEGYKLRRVRPFSGAGADEFHPRVPVDQRAELRRARSDHERDAAAVPVNDDLLRKPLRVL